MPAGTFEWASQAMDGHYLGSAAPSPAMAEESSITVDAVNGAHHASDDALASADSHTHDSKWVGVRGISHAVYVLKAKQAPPPTETSPRSSLAFFSTGRILRQVAQVAQMITPEQRALCHHAAAVVADYGSALLLLFALLEFCFFLSAVVVVKRASVLQHEYGRHLRASEPATAVVVSPLAAERA